MVNDCDFFVFTQTFFIKPTNKYKKLLTGVKK